MENFIFFWQALVFRMFTKQTKSAVIPRYENFFSILSQQSSRSINFVFILRLISSHSGIWGIWRIFLFYGLINSHLEMQENLASFFLKYKSFLFGARKFHFLKYKKFFHRKCFFRVRKVHSWNLRSFLKKFHFSKFKKSFFWENMRMFLILGLESSISRNIRKTFFWEHIRNFLRVDCFYFFHFLR